MSQFSNFKKLEYKKSVMPEKPLYKKSVIPTMNGGISNSFEFIGSLNKSAV